MMNWLNNVLETIAAQFSNVNLNSVEIAAMLLMILALSLYEFLVYRFISHRSFYNMSLHVSIIVIPFFIGAIVKSLQSNLAITLGTIGALAIIRFRTAVKDPVDIIYILWSVFIGICCGCSLYELCVYTSLLVTLILLIINIFAGKIFSNPFYLVINSSKDIEKEINELLKQNKVRYRLKSRNYLSGGVDYVYEIRTRTPKELAKQLNTAECITKFSIVEFDNNDII